ncbi:MAG: secretin N-terminal domain-containing protein [Thermoanaerobaculia bacterium]
MRRLLSAGLLVLLTAGCVSYKAQRSAQHAEDLGNWDQAVELYLQLLEREPTNLGYRSALLRVKLEASREHFAAARKLREEGKLEAALREFRLAVQLDPSNDYAAVEMRNTVEELANRRAQERGEPTLDELKQQVEQARPQPPMLEPRSDEPIDLSFPEPVPVRDIYEALGKGFGMNILFDQTLKEQSLTLEVREVRARDALEVVMRAAAHFYKVLDEHTILIADDNPQNRAKYEDLLIQTFYLSNADPKELTTVLRTLVGSRNVAPNEALNAIVLRDTADKVRVAERIINSNDKSRGEVVVDVELIQIDVGKMQELGVELGAYSVSQALDEDALPIRLSEPERIGQRANWLLTVPGVVYDFMKQDTDVQFLARPQLRISDGEQATLHIGDRVPIPVTTFNTGQTVGGNIVPITSFQYQDVGIRIDLEPRIHNNNEITLSLKVEVSDVSGQVAGTQGASQPIISTRTIESTIRLADGETNLLAGLIQTSDSRTRRGVPGLSDIPLIGRLFSHDETDRDRTDLVLTLTPHIIRSADVTAQDLQPIWVGTEQNITFRGGSPRLESEALGPFDEPARSPEEIRELIRERLERLQEEQEEGEPVEEEEAPEAPPGEDLVPGSTPGDIFRPEPEPEPEQPPEEPGELPEGWERPSDQEEPQSLSWNFDPETDVAADLVSAAPAAETSSAATGATTRTAAEVAAAIFSPVGQATFADNRPSRALAPIYGYAAASVPQREGGAGRTRPPREGEAGSSRSTRESVRRSDGGETPSVEGVRVQLSADRTTVAPGMELEVHIRVDSGRPVSHLPLTLEYDAAALEVLGVARGPFLGADGEATLLSDITQPGRVVLGASRLGELPGVTGAGIVASVRFRARDTGTSDLRLSQAMARDARLEEITPVSTNRLEVVVREGAVDRPPTPRRPRTRRPEA